MAKYVKFPNGEVYKHDRGLWEDAIASGRCVVMGDKEGRAERVAYLRRKLLEKIAPKSTLKVICTHCASSGMSARFVVLLPVSTESGYLMIQDITRDVAELCGFHTSKEGEIVMSGCGYSKSFQIVYELGRNLWPHGTPQPHGTRNGEPDSDGGYALGHSHDDLHPRQPARHSPRVLRKARCRDAAARLS